MQFQHLFYFRSIAVSLKVSESDKGRVLFWNPLELHYLDINLLQMRNDQLDTVLWKCIEWLVTITVEMTDLVTQVYMFG